ncbi:MAG: FAD-binding oxidoreductase [Halieaceae bacterium]
MSLIDELKSALGEAAILTDASAMAPYLADERGLYQGVAACVACPATTAEVATVVRLCRAAGYGVVPQGGNTGYCGGASPDSDQQLLLSLSRLNQIRAIDPVGMTATVEAGVILQNLQDAALAQELFFPLSMGSEGSCQIGGNLATNAGGLAVLKYGTAAEQVLGLEVVLPDGKILNALKPLRKDNTGYKLKSLFLGAEGTLGIITAAVVKLLPAPTEYQTAWLAVDSVAAACQLLPLARKLSGDTVTSFEYISAPSLALVQEYIEGSRPALDQDYPHQLLLELSAPLPAGSLRPLVESLLEDAMEQGLVLDAVLAESDSQRKALWRLRESIPEAEKHAGRSIKHDVCVAISDLPRYMAAAPEKLAAIGAMRPSIYGHIGDGNLHYNILAPPSEDADAFRRLHAAAVSAALHDLAAEMGGSFSAEHGVGKLKRGELAHYSDPVALDLMRTLKTAMDPEGLMNPGKLVDTKTADTSPES